MTSTHTEDAVRLVYELCCNHFEASLESLLDGPSVVFLCNKIVDYKYQKRLRTVQHYPGLLQGKRMEARLLSYLIIRPQLRVCPIRSQS